MARCRFVEPESECAQGSFCRTICPGLRCSVLLFMADIFIHMTRCQPSSFNMGIWLPRATNAIAKGRVHVDLRYPARHASRSCLDT